MKVTSRNSLVALLVIGLAACGPTTEGPGEGGGDGGVTDDSDADGDGYTPADGDCNDNNENVNPGVPDDTCDLVDNDCNGTIDDMFNMDGDGYSTCAGDCDDADETVYPGAPEELNGEDDDCDGIPDNNRDDTDDDGDGWTEIDGDCDDGEPLINPGAVEVDLKPDGNGGFIPEGVDNDCDGMIDEGNPTCDMGLNPNTAGDFAKAIELCSWVTSSTISAGSDARGRNIVGAFGNTYVPHAGSSMAVIGSGLTVDANDPSWVDPVIGTDFLNTQTHPSPQPDPADGCGQADPGTVNDYTELTFTIDVPSNAKSLQYDFAFMSGEFPQWVCSDYDDTFLAILDSSMFSGNISFDDAGNPVSINIGFFDVCNTDPFYPTETANCTGAGELGGTGYDAYGGTGWLTTIAPVTPGETITLRFIIFDEGDHIWDSLTLIDNFVWDAEPVDGPITVPREYVPAVRDQQRRLHAD